MKKCIVISDSFKGSLPSRDICAIACKRIPLFFPACEVRALNMADGGEGTVDCFLASCGGERVLVSGVQNPYGEPIDAAYGLLPDGTAVIEMAAAAGLPLVAGRKNPCVTTTYGVGQLIADALARGARRITVQDGQVRGGAWAPINGMELFGKTVGIIGYGAIGKQLGRLTNGIGMTTYAYDPFMNEAYAKEHNVLAADIDFIVRNCDIVSVHVPYMESTKNIISRERIFSMKDGAILINAARGGLVDEAAAAEALQSGKLAAAAFDAFEQEPLKDSPLLTAPNAILLPHTGSHTVDATKRMGMLAVDNVIRELSGTDCGYRVK